MFQQNLLFVKDLSSEYLKRLELVFSVLPNEDSRYTTGRPPHPVGHVSPSESAEKLTLRASFFYVPKLLF